jgi:hypothetical protein
MRNLTINLVLEEVRTARVYIPAIYLKAIVNDFERYNTPEEFMEANKYMFYTMIKNIKDEANKQEPWKFE